MRKSTICAALVGVCLGAGSANAQTIGDLTEQVRQLGHSVDDLAWSQPLFQPGAGSASSMIADFDAMNTELAIGVMRQQAEIDRQRAESEQTTRELHYCSAIDDIGKSERCLDIVAARHPWLEGSRR